MTETRTSWFPILVRRQNGVMELRIGWRDAQGHLSYFSKDGRAKINKSPIGPVHEVEYLEKGGNKNQDVFMITTKQRTKITFNVDNLNPTIWKICTWTNKWLELKTAGQEMQLARMLSALCQSKTFEYNLNTLEPTFTGPLQVWPMVYILYIGINLAIIMK